MRKNARMTKMQKYDYAMELLKQYGIETTSNVPTSNNYGDLVFHSKQLANVITIPPQATKETIKRRIEVMIEITKIWNEKNKKIAA